MNDWLMKKRSPHPSPQTHPPTKHTTKPCLEVDDDDEDEDRGEEVGDVGQVLAVEGLVEGAHLVGGVGDFFFLIFNVHIYKSLDQSSSSPVQ